MIKNENKQSDLKQAVDGMYAERNRSIIIGLTGRTGAGCSTVADILSRKRLRDMDLHDFKTMDFNNAEERKYRIIRNFMDEEERWTGFTVIQASTVIFSCIHEENKEDVLAFIRKMFKEGRIKCGGKIEEEFEDIFFEENNIENNIEFYTEKMKEKQNIFRKKTERYTCCDENGHDSNFYSYFMQKIGNNVRSSGSILSSEYKTGYETIIAEKIDKIIHMIIEKSKSFSERKIRICIDAFRNPFEIQYFRDRYRCFYVFAVNTEDEDRRSRLNLKYKELEGLDAIEYPNYTNTNYDIFFHQNISACLEIADVYIYNPNVYNHKFYELTEQLLKYIALMIQPGIVTPTHLERCMQLAFNAKYNSGCLSRQVGAVVTGADFSVRSVGWNDVPKGQIPCNLRCVEDYCENKDSESFSEFELGDEMFHAVMYRINEELSKKKEETGDNLLARDKLYSFCFKSIYNGLKGDKNQVHTRALHAEENAFLQIAKYGGAEVQGGKLFTTASPCELCSKKAYQLGIREIYYIDPYPGISKKHILAFGKTDNPEMILFKGAIGNAYISLYSQRMPYKDELELYTGISAKKCAEEVKKEKDDYEKKEKKQINDFKNLIDYIWKLHMKEQTIDQIAKECEKTEEFVKDIVQMIGEGHDESENC